MKATRPAVLAFIVALIVVGGTSLAVAAVPAPAPVGNVTPTLGPTNGEVAVVASGAAVDGKVAAIVQNGSTAPVRNLLVVGVATTADGATVTQARTHLTVPAVLAPAAIALVNLDFGKRGVPPGATVTFKVTSDPAASANDPSALAVSDFVLSKPLTGKVAQTLRVRVSNPQSRAVRGPLRVTVMCFNEASIPVTVTNRLVATKRLSAGKSVPTVVPLTTLCPSYLVGARAAS